MNVQRDSELAKEEDCPYEPYLPGSSGARAVNPLVMGTITLHVEDIFNMGEIIYRIDAVWICLVWVSLYGFTRMLAAAFGISNSPFSAILTNARCVSSILLSELAFSR